MILGTIFYLALLALLAESRIIYRDPDVLEVDRQLFIVDVGPEGALHKVLEEMIRDDEGDFTPWLNFDHSDMMMGSTGDYEWLRQIRTKEADYGDCIVPCEQSEIFAMEVDIANRNNTQIILEDCVELEPQARQPSIGFFCMNYDQRKRNSKCRKNPACHEYMTEHCMCPDFMVRYFCKGTAEERQQFCDRNEAQFVENLNSKKRSFDGLVAGLKQDGSEADVVARSIEGELDDVESKKMDKEGKVQSMLKQLISTLENEK